jgi:hypothetical protein
METDTLQPVQETPNVDVTADKQALMDSFNKSVAAEQGASVDEANDVTKQTKTEVRTPIKEAGKTESLIPAELMSTVSGEKKPDQQQQQQQQQDEPLVAEEVRNQIPKGKARESFEKLENAAKAKIDRLHKEMAELKAKQTTTALPADYEAKLKETAERAAKLEQELERTAFERSPKFQRYGQEEKAELSTAKAYLEGTEVNPSILEVAANTTGAARVKLLQEAGLDPTTIALISSNLNRVDALRRERDASLTTWKQSMEVEQNQSKQFAEQQEQQRVAEEKRIYESTMEKFKTIPAFTRVDGQEKWNALVEQNFKDAEDFAFGRKSLPELFELGIRGTAQRTTELMNQELTRRLEEANTRLAKLTAAQPTVGSPADSDVRKPNTGNPVKDEEERWKQSFNSEKAKITG